MLPYLKTGDELKLQKVWDFRRRDEEDLDSDDSKASSEPVVKKHKLVSNLISLDKSLVNDGRTKSKRVVISRNTRKDDLLPKSESRKDFHEENNRRKRGPEHAAMDDLKSFTGSLLKELEVSREKLFKYMREEMRNLEQNPQADHENNQGKNRNIVWETLQMDQRTNFEKNIEEERNRTNSKENIFMQQKNISNFRTRTQNCGQNNRLQQPQKSIILGIRAQTCNGEKGKRTENKDTHLVPEYRFDYSHAGDSVSLSKDLPSDAKFPVHSSSHIPSSMYLSLPTVLTETSVTNQKLDPLSTGYIQHGSASTKACTDLDSTSYCGRFAISKPEERFGQMSSINLNCFDGNRFPVPFLYGGFNIPSQGCSERLQEEGSNNSLTTLRMNRGVVRLSGGNYALSSQQYDGNKVHKESSYKSDGRHLVYQIPNINNGHLFQK